MVLELINGLMVEYSMDSIRMISKRVKEPISGQMEELTLVNGIRVNSKVLAFT